MILLGLCLLALAGCTLPGSNVGTLILSVPDSAYPGDEVTVVAVSYTHLTLPTILLV